MAQSATDTNDLESTDLETVINLFDTVIERTDGLESLSEVLQEVVEENISYFKSPEVGDTYLDADAPWWSDDPRVEVVSLETNRADREYFTGSKGLKLVSHANPEHPYNAPTVGVQYLNQKSDTVYSIPVTRLMPLPPHRQ